MPPPQPAAVESETAAGDGAARPFEEAGEPDPRLQVRRWRLFFLAVAELFGYRHGREWGISHYRFRRREAAGEPERPTEHVNSTTTEEP